MLTTTWAGGFPGPSTARRAEPSNTPTTATRSSPNMTTPARGGKIHLFPPIDEPICLIDKADANARYYDHFDGLESVVALYDGQSVPVGDTRCLRPVCDPGGAGVAGKSTYGRGSDD